MNNNIKLIVGLGNPGLKYSGTRHNVGFDFIDSLLNENLITKKFLKFNALIFECYINNYKTYLVKPQTYMNNSGVAVYQIMHYYKVNTSDLIVISDDVSLSPGYLRIRRSGSSGGHNGLNSIINNLHTDNFIRVRIGIGKNDNPDFNMIDWVLGIPSQKDSSDIEKVTNKANEIISILLDNVDSAMNKYNNHEQS